MAYSMLEIFLDPLMRCISPFDNGSYHMGTIRTNRTNRQLGQGRQASLSIQRVGNILPLMRCISPSDNGSTPNRRFHSNCTAFLRLVSIQVYWTTLRNKGSTRKTSFQEYRIQLSASKRQSGDWAKSFLWCHGNTQVGTKRQK